MAAYAALVSLAQTLENLIHSWKEHDDRTQSLVSLHQQLQDLLTREPAASIDSGVIFPLVSFSQTLRNYILEIQQGFDSDQLASLHHKITLLIEVFDKSPHRVAQWEANLGYFADRAESMIELIFNVSRAQQANIKNKDILLQVAKLTGELFDTFFNEVKNIIDADDSSPPIKLPSGNQIRGKEKLFGLDHHLDEVTKRLLSHVKKLEIVPIVGMGGIGKTSLARAAFDLPSVTSFFELRRWVNISQGYSAKAIMLAILDDKSPDGMSTSIIDLGVRVNQLLYGRRYLIVLDDIWDLDAWDEVQTYLRNDENRSRVVLTTRHENLAQYAKSSGFIHHMQLMNQETSWSVLKNRVFGEQPCPLELLEIGQKIANGCNGLPLAIVVISGILVNVNLDFDSWENIAKDVNKAIETSDDHFLEILALSYHHLPHYLRPCFLYMGAFPKDEHIHVSSLIKLWVGEGFLKRKNNSNDLEETAYEYFEEILKRNLIMATKKGYDGRTKFCEMHGLLRDLCLRKTHEESFFHHKHGLYAETPVRASFCRGETFQFINKQKLLYLRTALCFWNTSKLLSSLVDCTRLRVLDASRITSEKFPSQLMTSVHLRFLALSWTPKGAFLVPSDIQKLKNLRTFILKYEYQYVVEENMFLIMPVEIWRLANLRHLLLYPAANLPNPPTGNTPSLVNLKTLLTIRNLCFSDEMVKMIPNLRKLVVCYWIDVTKETWSDFQLHNLSQLRHLEYLRLQFTIQGYDLEWCKRNPLTKSLAFPSTLKVLKFEGGAARVSWEDMTRLTRSLPNLQLLKLGSHALSGDVWEVGEEDYQNLRVLEICGSYLKCWRSESSNPFSSLQRLVLIACPCLTELPDGIGDIPTLESVTVDDRQEAILKWVKQIEEGQREMRNTFLQVTVHKFAEVLEDGETDSRKAKLFKIWTDAGSDTDLRKKIILSLLYDDKDGLRSIIESMSPELHTINPQDSSSFFLNLLAFACMYWVFILHSFYSYWTSHI